MLFREGPPR